MNSIIGREAMRTVTWVLVASLALMLVVSLPVFPQANQGNIQGSVFDPSGAAIAGATVTIVDVARGVSRPLMTDSAGAYIASNLIPGTYTVRGQAAGFQVLEHANVVIEVGQTVRVDLVLQPGQQTQTVTVTSEAPQIDTTDTTLGGTLNRQTLDVLPMNGRNFKDAELLRPAIATFTGTAGIVWSANGSRTEDIGYLVDGLRADEIYTGNSAINPTTPLGDTFLQLPIEAIQEMNTEENPPADMGWKPGAIINIGLKSGANQLHGTAFAYGRDDAWDARDYFDNAPNPKQPIALEQYGGSIGGPIKKDKLFWYADYESQQYTAGTIIPITEPATVLLPGGNTAGNVKASLVNACLALGPSKITPLSAQIAGLNTTTCAVAPPNYTPGPTESFFPTVLSTSPIIPIPLADTHQYEGLVKLDYSINKNNTINGMYFNGRGLANGGSAIGLPLTSSSPWGAADNAHLQLASGAWNWTSGSNLVNEFRFGDDYFDEDYQTADHNVNPLAYGINTGVTAPLAFGLPGITITGFTQGFGGGQHKIVGPDSSLQVLDHFSIIHGNHTFKFGGEYIYSKVFSYQNSAGKGAIKFANLENFLQGIVNSTGNSILAGDPTRHLTDPQYALFFQDDWRVTRNVTLNLGLRWEYTAVIKESNNLLGGFRPSQGLVQVGKQISTPYDGDHRDFSPRLGVAWDIHGDGKTVIRAGGSVMYTFLPLLNFMALNNIIGISQTPTGARIVTQATGPAGVAGPGTESVLTESPSGSVLTPGWQAQTAACVSGGTTACGPIFPQSIFNIECGDGIGTDPAACIAPTVDPHLRNAYIATWTVGLQRAITNNLALNVSYVGTKAGDIADYIDINQSPFGSGFTAAQIAAGDPSVRSATAEQQARPFYNQFPYLSNIDELENVDRANYNALQAQLNQRVSHGLNFIVGYTYAHSLDDGSTYNLQSLPVDSTHPGTMYGNSDIDFRHRFTLAANYAIPGKAKSPVEMLEGWSLHSVVTLQSSQPWSPTDTVNDFAGNGEVVNSDSYGTFWNFSGNHSDFKPRTTPIPCWSGSSTAALSGCTLTTEPQACITAASAISANTLTALNKVGCYVSFNGRSVLIPPALGTVGDLSRNPFPGPGYYDWDLSVTKDWKFKERFDAQFRAEFFNVINHPNFNISSAQGAKFTPITSGGTAFGCSCDTPSQSSQDIALGTGGSRAIQLGLRLAF